MKKALKSLSYNGNGMDQYLSETVLNNYVIRETGKKIEAAKADGYQGSLAKLISVDEARRMEPLATVATQDLCKKFSFLYNDPKTANALIDPAIKGELVKDLAVEFDENKGIYKISGDFPNETETKAIADRSAFMKKFPLYNRLFAVAARADEAQKNVHFGSKEYDNAVKAIKALEQRRKA